MEQTKTGLTALVEQGYASRAELKPYIAKERSSWNDFLEMRDESIVDTDGNVWELIPEDRIFELKY